jgi:Trypsin-like peptidase domain
MPADFRRAICHFDCQGRGTGFLVAENLVLTAFHCVASVVQTKDWIDLTFARLDLTDPIVKCQGKVLDFDPANDWALLELDQKLAIDPVQVRPLRPHFAPEWSTFGYSKDAQTAGQIYGGRVRSFLGARIQLFMAEAAAEGGVKAPGLSGSPLMVNGYAVGIVTLIAGSDGAGIPTGGTLYAVPITAVAQGATAKKVPCFAFPAKPLPFCNRIADLINQANVQNSLIDCASKLLIPDPEQTPAAELAKLVAAEIMRQGSKPTAAALRPIADSLKDKATQVLDFSATGWLDEQAVELLWSYIADAPREKLAILLNAETPQLGLWFRLRSKCAKEAWPGARVSFLQVTDSTGLMQQVVHAMAEKLGCDPALVVATSKRHNYEKHPIVIVIPPPAPTPAQVAEVHGEFPKVRLLMQVSPIAFVGTRAQHPGAVFVDPPVPDGWETTHVNDYVDALDDLADALNPQDQL